MVVRVVSCASGLDDALTRTPIEGRGTEVLPRVVPMTGLSGRTSRRTVPDMFRRHRTDPDRDLASVVSAFHDRLAGTMVTVRTDPPRVERHELRDRLGSHAGVGLRARLDRPLRSA